MTCQSSNSGFILHENEASVIVVSVRTLNIGVRVCKCTWNLQMLYLPGGSLHTCKLRWDIMCEFHCCFSNSQHLNWLLRIATSMSTPVTLVLGFYNTAWRNQPDFTRAPKLCTIVQSWSPWCISISKDIVWISFEFWHKKYLKKARLFTWHWNINFRIVFEESNHFEVIITIPLAKNNAATIIPFRRG